MRLASFVVLLLVAIPAVPGGAQTRAEIIRGRITTDSGATISGATVSATMAPDRNVQQVTTDTSGRYVLRFERGAGDYLIHVAAVGYRSVRRRLQRSGADTVLVFDARLVPDVARLATVAVKATAQRPVRGDREGDDAGAAERVRDGVLAALPPDQEGNLAALANVLPGAVAQNGGLSVLGLDASQSNVTLNGMAYAGSSVPRDARTTTRVTTSAYDASRGGFSAGQIAVELGRGSRASLRRAHVTVDAPALQAPDALASRFGQRFTALTGSVGGSGEAVEDIWYYNAAAQLTQRMAPVATLLDADADALAWSGVSPDSVSRTLDLLRQSAIPLDALPAAAASTVASFAARLDHTPFLPGSNEPSPQSFNVATYGELHVDRAIALVPTATPSRGGARERQIGGVQGTYSRYFGNTLSESRLSISARRDRGEPSLALPGGNVLVSSQLPSGAGAVAALGFGGNSTLAYERRDWTLELMQEAQWYRRGTPHRLKLTADARLDGYRHAAPVDQWGTFSYPSLSALAAGRPATFSRALSSPDRRGGEWSGSLALGDYWRVTPTLLLLFGARVDGERFTRLPDQDPRVATLLGAPIGAAPSTIDLSPRFGFTWFVGGGEKGTRISINQYAVQPLPPAGVLRGGVGLFRGFLAPSLPSEALVATGRAGGETRLFCAGDAVPLPRFDLYAVDPASIPSTCAGGAPSALTDTAPAVRLFDPSFRAPRSWRGNLSWSSALGPFGVSLEGVYSFNLNQPGSVDLNFSGAPRFTLRDEGARPVFVDTASIDPASGTASPRGARLTGVFGRVVSARSDLRSVSRQITATITPARFGPVYYGVAYTLGDMRGDARGFDATTFASPTAVENGPGDLDLRHQIQLQFGTALPHGMSLGVFGRFSSGLPYTPRVAGDVNGDGLANDRAYIFNPAMSSDPALAAGMRVLLDGAPAAVRDCLQRQLGRPAEHNSCRGPWTASVNARLTLVSRASITSRGYSAALNLSNPLGGLDQLLHGESGLRGWGAPAAPDPMLLVVRGFDRTAQRYRYEVNPRFGSPLLSGGSRVPFRITVDVTIDLGVPLEKQQAVRLLEPGRGRAGTRLTADTIAVRLARWVPDIYQAILDEGDSLLINRAQAEALQSARIPYRARMDSLWREASRALAAMDEHYDADDAMHVVDDATERAWIINRDELTALRSILSPLQLTLAPWVPALARSEGAPRVGIRIIAF